MSRSELKQILRATEETLGRTEAVLEATTFRFQADLVEARREIEVAVKFCNLLQTGSEKIRKDLIQKHYRHKGAVVGGGEAGLGGEGGEARGEGAGVEGQAGGWGKALQVEI